MANLRHVRSRTHGLALIETALILPLLLLLVFAVLEYGWMFLKAQEISNAARHGARLAVRPDTIDAAQVQAGVAGLMQEAQLDDSGYTVTISNVNVDPGQLVSVEVSVPYAAIGLTGLANLPANAPVPSLSLPAPVNLRAKVSMAKEGP